MPNVPGIGSVRAIADLVRCIIHARRGLSRTEVVNWVSQFLDDVDRVQAAIRVESVVDTLCELKDIGYGTMHGEPVLVALPVRRVELPDGSIVALGDHGISGGTGAEQLFPEVAGGTTESLVELLASFDGPVPLGAHRVLEPTGCWTGDKPMPAAIRRALSLCGAFDPVEEKWSLSEDNTSFLNEWFNLTPPESSLGQVKSLDDSQRRLVKAVAGTRMVVEAGPGKAGGVQTHCDSCRAQLAKKAKGYGSLLVLRVTVS